ncbi:MAG: RagB/SusD family nutrient uptake outer membrane protein [Chitinophagaceae bacterium]|nr:MAG: RagB/SusD family nutrient uptake outer membrane protein [Chitinophagaceae bacterium]
MKKVKYIFFISILGLASCKKEQLELYPYNQIETTQAFNTEADVTLAVNGMYAGLRTSGSYFVSGIWNIMADVLADNLIINQAGRQTLKTYGEWRYTGENTSGLFSGGYTIVRRANAILENIDAFPDGAFKNNTKGEALALRALVYFDMARLFSKTYENASDADLGLPYVTATDPTVKPANESVKSFYGKVIADLELAKTLIGTSNGIYRLNRNSVQGLLSRVYFYKGDMAATITASNDALGATPNVASRTDFPKIWTDEVNTGVLFKVRNSKQDNQNAQGVNYYQVVSGERKSEYVVEYNFNAMFLPEDIRTSTYISKSKFNQVEYNNVIKYNARANGDPAGVVDAKVLRTAEVLLNRAEAYARTGNTAGAVADIILLRTNRYSPYNPAKVVDGGNGDVDLSGQPLLDTIYKERRLELAFEGDRFFDLKRRNQPVLRDGTKGEKADGTGTPYVFTTLAAGDHKFQLPFPQIEVNYNTNLKQNPGY